MLKATLLVLVFSLTIIGVKAEVSEVKYGEYIKCYYEIVQASSESVIRTQTSLTLMPKMLEKLKGYETSLAGHDFYSFTNEGFYAGTASDIQKKYGTACNKARGDKSYEVAIDFYITANNKKFPLCFYSKDVVLLQPNDKLVNSCTEIVSDGNCDDNIYTAHDSNKDISIRPLLNVNVKDITRLDPKYFYKILYPFIQEAYSNMADDVLLNKFWTDSDPKSQWRYKVLQDKIETLKTCQALDMKTKTRIIVVPK